MNKRRWFSALLGLIVILAGVIIYCRPWGAKPFQNLSASEIAAVSVTLLPPDEAFDLSSAEIMGLTDILHSVVLYRKDNSCDQYVGQAVIYTITKTDGTTLTITAFNPFLIIDGVGYQTKYEPCEKLNALGNRILNSK